MAQYCKAGDTARVTLPDDGKVTFVDTPIDIKCDSIWNEPVIQVNVTVSYTYLQNPTTPITRVIDTNSLSGYVAFIPVAGIRVTVENNRNLVQVLHKTSSNQEEPVWMEYGNTLISRPITNASIVSVTPKFPPIEEIPPRKQLTITGASGADLFFGIFENCGYSVECLEVEECPPNTLDCGDCCLPCNLIFNQLSAVRAQLARVR